MLHVLADDGPEHEPGPPAPDHADEVAGTSTPPRRIASIPEEFRIAVVLADVHDMAYEEMLEVLDVPVGTVKSRVHRGRLALGGDPRHRSAREPGARARDVGAGAVTHPLEHLAAYVDGTLAPSERGRASRSTCAPVPGAEAR